MDSVPCDRCEGPLASPFTRVAKDGISIAGKSLRGALGRAVLSVPQSSSRYLRRQHENGMEEEKDVV